MARLRVHPSKSVLVFLLSACSTSSPGGQDGGSSGWETGGSGGDDNEVVPLGSRKRFFVTSSEYAADMGGIVGADSHCSDAADSVDLGGQWKAWISGSGTNAIDRVADVGPWFSVDEKVKFFANKDQLREQPLTSLGITERAEPLGADEFVWTGTATGGQATGEDCSSWSSYGGYGMVGEPAVPSKWTEVSGSDYHRAQAYCAKQYAHHLYCIEE